MYHMLNKEYMLTKHAYVYLMIYHEWFTYAAGMDRKLAVPTLPEYWYIDP